MRWAFWRQAWTDWTSATDEQFDAASAFLRKVHANVRTYWADGASLAQLMQSGEVYLAWAWNETFSTMSYEGHPIAIETRPGRGRVELGLRIYQAGKWRRIG